MRHVCDVLHLEQIIITNHEILQSKIENVPSAVRESFLNCNHNDSLKRNREGLS